MAKNETRQFLERKAKVEQALKSEKFTWVENYVGISTVKRLVKTTGINEQAVKRIIANFVDEDKVTIVEDKSHIILLKER